VGILTLLQIRTEVDSIMGNRTGVDDPRLDTWINLAYTDVATGIDFEDLDLEETIATVIGDFEYAGPVSTLGIQLVRDEDNDNLLIWVPKQDYYRLSRAANGVPRKWTRRGSDILISPPADAAYDLTVLHKAAPAALVADGDITILPPYVDNALIFLGAAYGFMAVNEDQRAVLWLNRAINFLSSRLTDQDFSFLLGGLAKTLPQETPGGDQNAG
jgi:hypothetical protein